MTKLKIVHPPPEKKARPQDPIWNWVAFFWFGGTKENGFEVARPLRPRCGRIVSDLKALGATPDDLAKRIERYTTTWPDCECTPEAMVKHWTRFAADDPGQDRLKRQAQRALAALREQAAHDQMVEAANEARRATVNTLSGGMA